ncbi:MAG: hypothetical protein RR544_07455, partial [Oscillospiraceae bacterium]
IYATYENNSANVNTNFTGYEQLGDVVLIGSGETKSFTFNSFNTGNLLKASEITRAEFQVKIANPTTELGSGRFMQAHEVSSNAKAVMASHYWYGSAVTRVAFDATEIFRGIGL